MGIQDIDESIRKGEPADAYVMRMAQEKANCALGKVSSNQPVLAADTSVVCDSDVLGKPADESDALEMLR